MNRVTRRRALAGVALASLSSVGSARGAVEDLPRLRVLVIGGHPGDPEAGCGGTMACLARDGHEVTALYLTRGEAGVTGKTHEEAARIRSAEAVKACEILKAKWMFAGQVDAATEVNSARSAEFTKLIAGVSPNVVFTQWPVDTHADHRACAGLTLGAWNALGRKFALYFYEVDLGSDTQCFRPTVYVDVTEVEPLKRKPCVAHASQNPQGFYNRDHVPMMKFRGMECGRKMAEGFVHHEGSVRVGLPA